MWHDIAAYLLHLVMAIAAGTFLGLVFGVCYAAVTELFGARHDR